MRYHPDRNPNDPESYKKFHQILEAYEILTGQQKPKGRPKRTPKPAKSPEDVMRERMKKARERKKQQEEQDEREQFLFFKKITTGQPFLIFRFFAIMNAMIALGFTVDYFSPSINYSGKVTDYKTGSLGFYKVDIGQLMLEVPTPIFREMSPGGIVHVSYTPIFNIPTSLEIVEGYSEKKIMVHSISVNSLLLTLYLFFPLTQLVFLFPVFQWYYKRPTIYYTMAHYGGIYILPGIFLLSFLISFRIY